MNACIAAGSHAHLIDPLGNIVDHPDRDQRGLVLELIPPTFKILGLPPSMQSCTRDNFTEDAKLSFQFITKVLMGIASAAQHIHIRGISHGDLYAHNILVDESGYPLFGDFGAATVYKSAASSLNEGEAALIERLEVCAFGWLVDDLIKQCTDFESIKPLQSLVDSCTAFTVSSRPTFEEVCLKLSTLVN